MVPTLVGGRVVRVVVGWCVLWIALQWGAGKSDDPSLSWGFPLRQCTITIITRGRVRELAKLHVNAIAHLAARWCVHVRTPKYTQPNCNPLRSRVHYLPILRLHATSNMHLLRCSTVGRVVITKNRSVVGEFGRFRTSPCERPTWRS